MRNKHEADQTIEELIVRAKQKQGDAKKNPLDALPKATPRSLGPEGTQLKSELEQLLEEERNLTHAQRSERQFERLMTARKAPPTLPLTEPHPILQATIEAVERIRAARLSDVPPSDDQLAIDLIFAGNTEAFDILARRRRWDIDRRIALLEQAEEELAKATTQEAQIHQRST